MTKSDEERRAECPCPKTKCQFHGLCDSCRERHYARKGLPYCERKRGGKRK